MDATFIKIIKMGLEKKALKCLLQVGQEPSFFVDQKFTQALEFDEIEEDYLLKVYQMLKKEASSLPQKPDSIKINIGGGSSVAALIKGEPPSITLYYLPLGEELLKIETQEESSFQSPPQHSPSQNSPSQHSSPQIRPTAPQNTPPTNISKESSSSPSSHRITYEADNGGITASGSTQNPIDQMLIAMVKQKASDLHLTMTQPVIMRIDGDIERLEGPLLNAQEMMRLLDPIIPERNRIEFIEINDTDFAYEVKGTGRFRVNMFRDRNGVCAVLRHIPSQILTAGQLNLPQAVMDFCRLSKGLVLVTGPTGSGKSTTLAAMIDYINKTRAEHILTIEDPIEFVHPQYKCLMNQREISRHTTSFGKALRAALREDPDVVLIGEMRDLETVATAIETAETGHLVFGTLHTNTAMSTVDRIIDIFPAERQSQIRTMLAAGLKGVISQTLLKKKGGGRIAALEILVPDDAASALIRDGKIHQLANHMMMQKAKGNQLLNDVLIKLIKEGAIDPNDGFLKSVDKKSFLGLAKAAGIKIDGVEV